MKSLPIYISEKLIVTADSSKNNISININNIINRLFNDIEDEDMKFAKGYINYITVVYDMIYITMSAYSNKDRTIMYNSIKKMIREKICAETVISGNEFNRALLKHEIDTASGYRNEIGELYELINCSPVYKLYSVDFNIDDHMFAIAVNDDRMLFFLRNNRTEEIYCMFIIEFK